MLDQFGNYLNGDQSAPYTPGNSLLGGGGGGGLAGGGSPEGAVTAEPGHTYLDTATGAFYAKKTGSGNSGWLPLVV